MNTQDQEPRAIVIAEAMRRAYSLGQTYWQQADSDSFVQHRKADETTRKFHALIDETCAAIASPAAGVTQPINMVLHCPRCGVQHIDAPEPDKVRYEDGVAYNPPGWTNPPHRSHLCHDCGHVWRPADVPTNGVAAVKTTGKADSPLAAIPPAAPAPQRQVRTDPLQPWTPEHCRAYPTEAARLLNEAAPAPQPTAQPVPLSGVCLDGSTLYELGAHRINRWWATVHPGYGDDGKQTSDEECRRIARALAGPEPAGEQG